MVPLGGESAGFSGSGRSVSPHGFEVGRYLERIQALWVGWLQGGVAWVSKERPSNRFSRRTGRDFEVRSRSFNFSSALRKWCGKLRLRPSSMLRAQIQSMRLGTPMGDGREALIG